MPAQDQPVWFITGCSTGFGREIARAVLDKGWRLVATARDPGKVADLAEAGGDRALALRLDVKDPGQIEAAVRAAKAKFGRIDVLVNNAGHGYAATIEEGEDDKIRAMFDANVFGLAAVTRAVLPIMRAQKSGHVVNISSQAGIFGNPGTGYYAASKFAVEGMSDALAKEVGPLGIKVLLVEPGPFRTEFRGGTTTTDTKIADYEPTAGVRMRALAASGGKQPGDPVRAAAAIIAAVTAQKPPMRLLLGGASLGNARDKLAAMQADFDAWAKTTIEVDYPEFRKT